MKKLAQHAIIEMKRDQARCACGKSPGPEHQTTPNCGECYYAPGPPCPAHGCDEPCVVCEANREALA